MGNQLSFGCESSKQPKKSALEFYSELENQLRNKKITPAQVKSRIKRRGAAWPLEWAQIRSHFLKDDWIENFENLFAALSNPNECSFNNAVNTVVFTLSEFYNALNESIQIKLTSKAFPHLIRNEQVCKSELKAPKLKDMITYLKEESNSALRASAKMAKDCDQRQSQLTKLKKEAQGHSLALQNIECDLNRLQAERKSACASVATVEKCAQTPIVASVAQSGTISSSSATKTNEPVQTSAIVTMIEQAPLAVPVALPAIQYAAYEDVDDCLSTAEIMRAQDQSVRATYLDSYETPNELIKSKKVFPAQKLALLHDLVVQSPFIGNEAAKNRALTALEQFYMSRRDFSTVNFGDRNGVLRNVFDMIYGTVSGAQSCTQDNQVMSKMRFKPWSTDLEYDWPFYGACNKANNQVVHSNEWLKQFLSIDSQKIPFDLRFYDADWYFTQAALPRLFRMHFAKLLESQSEDEIESLADSVANWDFVPACRAQDGKDAWKTCFVDTLIGIFAPKAGQDPELTSLQREFFNTGGLFSVLRYKKRRLTRFATMVLFEEPYLVSRMRFLGGPSYVLKFCIETAERLSTLYELAATLPQKATNLTPEQEKERARLIREIDETLCNHAKPFESQFIQKAAKIYDYQQPEKLKPLSRLFLYGQLLRWNMWWLSQHNLCVLKIPTECFEQYIVNGVSSSVEKNDRTWYVDYGNTLRNLAITKFNDLMRCAVPVGKKIDGQDLGSQDSALLWSKQKNDFASDCNVDPEELQKLRNSVADIGQSSKQYPPKPSRSVSKPPVKPLSAVGTPPINKEQFIDELFEQRRLQAQASKQSADQPLPSGAQISADKKKKRSVQQDLTGSNLSAKKRLESQLPPSANLTAKSAAKAFDQTLASLTDQPDLSGNIVAARAAEALKEPTALSTDQSDLSGSTVAARAAKALEAPIVTLEERETEPSLDANFPSGNTLLPAELPIGSRLYTQAVKAKDSAAAAIGAVGGGLATIGAAAAAALQSGSARVGSVLASAPSSFAIDQAIADQPSAVEAGQAIESSAAQQPKETAVVKEERANFDLLQKEKEQFQKELKEKDALKPAVRAERPGTDELVYDFRRMRFLQYYLDNVQQLPSFSNELRMLKEKHDGDGLTEALIYAKDFAVLLKYAAIAKAFNYRFSKQLLDNLKPSINSLRTYLVKKGEIGLDALDDEKGNIGQILLDALDDEVIVRLNQDSRFSFDRCALIDKPSQENCQAESCLYSNAGQGSVCYDFELQKVDPDGSVLSWAPEGEWYAIDRKSGEPIEIDIDRKRKPLKIDNEINVEKFRKTRLLGRLVQTGEATQKQVEQFYQMSPYYFALYLFALEAKYDEARRKERLIRQAESANALDFSVSGKYNAKQIAQYKDELSRWKRALERTITGKLVLSAFLKEVQKYDVQDGCYDTSAPNVDKCLDSGCGFATGTVNSCYDPELVSYAPGSLINGPYFDRDVDSQPLIVRKPDNAYDAQRAAVLKAGDADRRVDPYLAVQVPSPFEWNEIARAYAVWDAVNAAHLQHKNKLIASLDAVASGIAYQEDNPIRGDKFQVFVLEGKPDPLLDWNSVKFFAEETRKLPLSWLEFLNIIADKSADREVAQFYITKYEPRLTPDERNIWQNTKGKLIAASVAVPTALGALSYAGSFLPGAATAAATNAASALTSAAVPAVVPTIVDTIGSVASQAAPATFNALTQSAVPTFLEGFASSNVAQAAAQALSSAPVADAASAIGSSFGFPSWFGVAATVLGAAAAAKLYTDATKRTYDSKVVSPRQEAKEKGKEKGKQAAPESSAKAQINESAKSSLVEKALTEKEQQWLQTAEQVKEIRDNLPTVTDVAQLDNQLQLVKLWLKRLETLPLQNQLVIAAKPGIVVHAQTLITLIEEKQKKLKEAKTNESTSALSISKSLLKEEPIENVDELRRLSNEALLLPEATEEEKKLKISTLENLRSRLVASKVLESDELIVDIDLFLNFQNMKDDEESDDDGSSDNSLSMDRKNRRKDLKKKKKNRSKQSPSNVYTLPSNTYQDPVLRSIYNRFLTTTQQYLTSGDLTKESEANLNAVISETSKLEQELENTAPSSDQKTFLQQRLDRYRQIFQGYAQRQENLSE